LIFFIFSNRRRFFFFSRAWWCCHVSEIFYRSIKRVLLFPSDKKVHRHFWLNYSPFFLEKIIPSLFHLAIDLESLCVCVDIDVNIELRSMILKIHIKMAPSPFLIIVITPLCWSKKKLCTIMKFTTLILCWHESMSFNMIVYCFTFA
jgi:hypothetical protein